MNDLSDNCATLLTPATVGAIAVLALAGPRAAAVVADLTGRRQPFTMHRTCLVKFTDGGHSLDEAILIRRAEDAFEIHVHGGTAVVQSMLAALAARGIPAVSAQNVPARLRSFGPDTDDSAIAAEALAALPEAGSVSSLRLLLAQRRSGLSAWAAENLQRAQQAAAGDAKRDVWWRLSTQAQWILDCHRVLRHLMTPPRVAIIGPPNAGKSTLANMLLGRPGSIVSDQPGTTRDWVDAPAQIGDAAVMLGVVLVDTAGVRVTDDPIEIQSISRTHQQADLADLIIFVVDGSTWSDAATLDWFAALTCDPTRQRCPVILALNKADQPVQWSGQEIVSAAAKLAISARTGLGLDALQSEMMAVLGLSHFDPDEPVAFTLRQRRILKRVAQADSASTAAADLTELLHGPL